MELDLSECDVSISLITIETPYLRWLPDFAKYTKRDEINAFHRKLCKKLGIMDVYEHLEWKFEKRFKAVWGLAEYGPDEDGKQFWRVRYAADAWLPMGWKKRKHIITHEICHLAVERLYGHCPNPPKGHEPVLDHGKHWQDLMILCGQDPCLLRKYKR